MPDSMDCGLTGRCDFCQFSNLKLSPLTCMRHFYCQTCRKYVTSLQKNDFSCKLCVRKQRQIQSERQRESHILDSFIAETATQRRARHFHEVPITMSGSQVIPLHNDKDEGDQHDLTGNNEEWDLLISSLSYEPSCAEKQPAAVHRDKQSTTKRQPSDRFLKKGTSRCNAESKEKPTQPPSDDKFSGKSRIYDWCVAAKNSLTSTKASNGFEQVSSQTVSVSSSSENNMAKMKYQQQKKKKERPFWWDEDQSDSDAYWDECFSETAPFFKRTSGKAEQDGHCHESMRKRNCTPVAGLNLRTAVSENSTVTSLESDEQRSLFKDESLFTKQNTGPNACRNNNMGEKDSSHQTLLKDDKSSFRNVLEQSPSTETKTTDKDDAVLMSTLFKESRVNSKDQIFKREWPPKEPARQNSPALGGSSREQLVTARNRTWLDRQPSISPVDFNDSFWDQ